MSSIARMLVVTLVCWIVTLPTGAETELEVLLRLPHSAAKMTTSRLLEYSEYLATEELKI